MEVFFPPRVTAMAERRPRYGSSRRAHWTYAPAREVNRGTSTSPVTVERRSGSSPLASRAC
eukprot:14058978-Alexandrium_andersonii.AAC.1